jgi:hypothetical protein
VKFTHHAVERYRQFHMLDRPGATDADARAELEAAAPSAVKGGTSRSGDPMWMIQSLGIEVVAKHEDGVDIAVTVLPPARFRGGVGKSWHAGRLGLTPLQVESLQASAQRAEFDFSDAQAELDALPLNPQKPSRDVETRRDEHRLAIARREAKNRVTVALVEREVFAAAFKNARIQMQHDSSAEHRAIAIAIRALRDLAKTSQIAGLAVAAIESLLE